MAGGLDQDNSRAVSLFETFGIYVWNRARQGLLRNNFNSAFGRVSVFGNDSVRVDYFDEFSEFIGSYTQPAGHLVATKGLTVAPLGVNFDTVTIGQVGRQALNLVNSGVDTIRVFSVSRLTPSRPSPFVVNPPGPGQLTFPLLIPPGQSRILAFGFTPTTQGFAADTVLIVSDDPDNTVGLGAGVYLDLVQGFISPFSQGAVQLPLVSAHHLENRRIMSLSKTIPTRSTRKPRLASPFQNLNK